jgi:hypothetical protein
MQIVFEKVSEITTKKDYDNAMEYVKKMIIEASLNGALSDPEADNDYVREIGRIGHLCAVYENRHIQFEHLTTKKKTAKVLEYA